MRERVLVRRLRGDEYAAEVTEGQETTNHLMILGGELVDELRIAGVPDERIAEESVKFLLERAPVTALPHELDLARLAGEDPDYAGELRARLAG